MIEARSRRLIEEALCLEQASLEGSHEKLCHAGHVKSFHIWPARRPLAACRAALISTLLRDPGTAETRRELCEKIGGKVVKRIEKKKLPSGQTIEREKEETEGGILHWGSEIENAETLEWLRQQIRNAYGGRAPLVVDPFAGGGAIPLEAMRLGCAAAAIDINPVAWFILKCTLEYPQQLAGQKQPLPAFILTNRAFMETFFNAQGLAKAQIRRELEKLGHANDKPSLPGMDVDGHGIDADLAWHVRAWGQRVLDAARMKLTRFYPVYADFEPLDKNTKSYESQPTKQMPLKDDGTVDIGGSNAEFSAEYLEVKSNPRWVVKPTVAFLWARTVTCKNCRLTIPLLKSLWLSKKPQNRVRFSLVRRQDGGGVDIVVEDNVPQRGGNAAQCREHDRLLGQGTMSRAGAKCPSCGTIMTMADLRVEGLDGNIRHALTAKVRLGAQGKEFVVPTEHDISALSTVESHLLRTFEQIPFGMPTEPLATANALGFRVPLYGYRHWNQLFTPRQLLVLGSLVGEVRDAAMCMKDNGYDPLWREAVTSYLACVVDKVADYNSAFVAWQPAGVKGANTFQRWALPMKWDFVENNILESDSGGWDAVLSWVTKPLDVVLPHIGATAPAPLVQLGSAVDFALKSDVIVTDPPYYDAIPYSDLMDFFYVWLRRMLFDMSDAHAAAFQEPLSPKWNHDKGDGELIDESSRHGGNASASKNAYEQGMFRAFQSCHRSLQSDGRLVIVFANKQPDAWETLVSALIRAGFVVDASWPIQTEMGNRMRALSSSALASSVWLVCKKRPETARPGWDNKVFDDMRANIGRRLREFWDAGIRGPDFVWAATGPALEAYSKHPVVKMANEPNATLTVTEFLNHARRMVVDFVVGRVLSRAEGRQTEGLSEGDGITEAAVDHLDETTAYCLLHRNDFGLDEAPVGACILYATACGLSDQELVRDWDLLAKTGGDEAGADAEEEGNEGEDEPVEATGSGSKVKLKAWNHRRGRSLGIEAPGGRPVPLVDRIHRLMHLWKAGDVHKVDEYLDEHGLRRHELFRRVLQSLIELAKAGAEERSLLESLSNHIGAKGAKRRDLQRAFPQLAETPEGGSE